MQTFWDAVKKSKYWLMFLLIGVIGIIVVQGQYNTSISACERGNVLREVTFQSNELAAASRKNSAKSVTGFLKIEDLVLSTKFHAEAQKLIDIPYANPNGTVRCEDAIHEPFQSPFRSP